MVLVVIQAVQISRTLYLGGTTGPVADMTPAQLDALDAGYTYSLLWVAAVAVLVGISAFVIRLSARRSPPPSTPARRSRPASCSRTATAAAQRVRDRWSKLARCDHPYVRAVLAHTAR